MQQDIELVLPDGSIARFLFSGLSCWVEVRVVDEEFAPARTTFSDGLSTPVGQAMVDRVLKGAPMFERCGHPVTLCGCFVKAPEADYAPGASETGFGASPVPAVEFEWLPTSQPLPMAMAQQGPRWWLAMPTNINHPRLKH